MPLKVTFHEFIDDKLVFVLPAKAKEGELSDVSVGALSEMAYACFPDYLSPLQIGDINTGGISI